MECWDTSKYHSIIVLSPIKRTRQLEIVCFLPRRRHKSCKNNNKIIFVCKLWRLRLIRGLNVSRIITWLRLPSARLITFCCFLLAVKWRRADESNLFLEWFHTLECEMKLNDREWKMIACVRAKDVSAWFNFDLFWWFSEIFVLG